MFIQGNLQALFDALYEVGAIDPILKLDWSEVTEEMARNQLIVKDALNYPVVTEEYNQTAF